MKIMEYEYKTVLDLFWDAFSEIRCEVGSMEITKAQFHQLIEDVRENERKRMGYA